MNMASEDGEYALYGLTFVFIAFGLLTAFYLCYLRYRQMQDVGLEALLVQQPQPPQPPPPSAEAFRDRRRG